jgi:protein SMG6
LKISSSPLPRPAQPTHNRNNKPIQKLYNPDSDPIPTRWTAEPESLPDDHPKRQLFDHRKDDPVRFSVLARPPHSSSSARPTPTPKLSGDHVSASSTSSYAASLSSSNFTLSSTTDGSSASSNLFDGRPNQSQGADDSGNSIFSIQLKKLYRALTNLETKIKQEDADDVEDEPTSRVMLKGKEIEPAEVEREKWKKHIKDHKEYVL